MKRLIGLLLFTLVNTWVIAQEVETPEKTVSPYFWVQSDEEGIDQMPLKATYTDVNIAGVIADVKISQVYVNEGQNTLEAIYIFPGSTRAAVYGMTMTIGERKLVAKIEEKGKAREQYEAAKEEGKTASLLEQERPNVFQMSVANILPGDSITVELSYTELLVPTDAEYEFAFPTVVGPRYSNTPESQVTANEDWVENPYLHEGEAPNYDFRLNTHLNAGLPIQQITCTSHEVDINYTGKNSASIDLKDSELKAGNKDFILKYRLAGEEIQSGLLRYEGEEENFFLLMMQPPKAPSLEQIPPREYVFIVDVSGSMNGFPLNVSKELLRNLIGNLGPEDKFNVLLFAGASQMMSPESMKATQKNIEKAIEVIDNQEGSGGTELILALEKALAFKETKDYSRTFIVVTDGYVSFEQEAFDVIRDNLNEANLFAFGIGSSINRHLIEGMAHVGLAEPFFVTKESEGSSNAEKFRNYIQNPVLTNIEVSYDGFDVYDIATPQIPDVFAERPIILYGKYKGEATGNINIKGKSGNQDYEASFDVGNAETQNNQALRYLWARKKIQMLDDYINNFYDPENIEEVTNLGLKYNLLTAYTSFIAIDETIRNESGASETVIQPLPLPEGVSDLAVSGASYTSFNNTKSLNAVVVSSIGYSSGVRDVAASYSIANNKVINHQPINNPILILQNESGVQLDRQGSGRVNLAIRGQADLFNTSAFVMMDERSLIGAGTNTFATQQTPLSSLDIELVELIRGPSSVLYGPGVTTGLVHFMTKDPFRYPGATIELTYGELNTFKMAGRYAWHNDTGTFGFKVVGQYQRSNEWTLNEDDPTDAKVLEDIQEVTEVRDPRTGEVIHSNITNLQDYNEHWSMFGELELRPHYDLKLNINAGLARSNGLFWNALGEGRDNSINYHGQVRLTWKGLFAQVYYNANNQVGDVSDGSFLYRSDNLSFVNREQLEGQIRYTFDIYRLNTDITIGADSRNIYSDSETLVYGQNENDDNFSIQGAYFQSNTRLFDKLKLTLATRFDYYNHLNQSSFAPRAALTYDIHWNHSLHFSYNRTYAPHAAFENNADFLLSGGNIQTWLSGNKRDITLDGNVRLLSDPNNSIPATSVSGLTLQDAFAAYASLAGLDATTIGNLMIDLPVPATPLTLSNVAPLATSETLGQALDPVTTPKTDLRTEDTFEIGYRGTFANKLSVSLDVYHMRQRNVVALRPITPGLGDPSIAAQLQPFVSDITANLSPTVGAETATKLANQIVETAINLNGSLAYYTHSELPAPNSIPFPGMQTLVNQPIIGFGYQQFGEVNYFGADLSLKYFIRHDLSIFYNHSWLGQTVFTGVDQGESSSTLPYNLQLPKNRIRTGIAYDSYWGFFANAQYQFQEQFFSDIGANFTGTVKERHLFNGAVGYHFDFGLTLILSAQNIMNQRYRTYANLPEIGRRTTFTARFNF